jgi:hypothetical protein
MCHLKKTYLLHKTKGDRNILVALLNSVSNNAKEAWKKLHVTEIVFTGVSVENSLYIAVTNVVVVVMEQNYLVYVSGLKISLSRP